MTSKLTGLQVYPSEHIAYVLLLFVNMHIYAHTHIPGICFAYEFIIINVFKCILATGIYGFENINVLY